MGADEFLVNLTVSHLLGGVKLYNGRTKVMERGEGRITWNIHKSSEETFFEPNMVILPIAHFRLEMRLKSTKSQE